MDRGEVLWQKNEAKNGFRMVIGFSDSVIFLSEPAQNENLIV